jgi:hypothetical protein
VIAADPEVPLGVSGAHRELARRERRLRAQKLGVEADGLAVDRLPGLAEELDRARMVELHPDLPGEAVDPVVDGRQGLFRERLEPRSRVHDHGRSV